MKTLNWFKSFVSFLLFGVIVLSCSEEKDEPQIDCSISGLGVTTSAIEKVTCSDGGKATLVATGGQAPYKYSIDGVIFATSASFSNLSAKSYTGTVKDANGCKKEVSFSIDANDNLVELVEAKVDVAAGCGTSLGKITITSSGGTGAHTYGIDGKALTTSNEFTNLSSGNHSLVIRDSEGCQISESIYVPSGVKFGSKAVGQSESISDIITNKCAIAGCHVAGTSKPDFTVFANIKIKAPQIKVKTQDGTMPKTGTITEEQKDLIACWVEYGAKDN